MVNTNKIVVRAVAFGAVVIFLAVALAPRCTDAQTFPKLDSACKLILPDILDDCFTHVWVKPKEDCCKKLQNATVSQVDCLCDSYIANPTFNDKARTFATGILTNCSVSDKIICKETKKEKGSNSDTKNNNGEANKKTDVSMAAFALVTTIFFALF